MPIIIGPTNNETEVIDKYRNSLRAMLKDREGGCSNGTAFTNEELDIFLNASLAEFNSTPHFTNFTWDTLPDMFMYIINMGAWILGITAQSLREAGREFNITDAGVTFQPPPVSAHMQTLLSNHITIYQEKLKFIKLHFKPYTQGVGTYQVLAVNPMVLKLKHLREKRIV